MFLDPKSERIHDPKSARNHAFRPEKRADSSLRFALPAKQREDNRASRFARREVRGQVTQATLEESAVPRGEGVRDREREREREREPAVYVKRVERRTRNIRRLRRGRGGGQRGRQQLIFIDS